MPKAWRVSKADYVATALTGDGARRTGGRWNPPGMPALYASDSLALAMLEVLVHFDPSLPMADYVAFEIDVPEEKILTLRPSALPRAWPDRDSVRQTQQLGKSCLADRSSFALRVPSAVVGPEHNYILNPAHPEFPGWMATQLSRPPLPLSFDPRLLVRLPTPSGN